MRVLSFRVHHSCRVRARIVDPGEAREHVAAAVAAAEERRTTMNEAACEVLAPHGDRAIERREG